jgi:ribosomal protein S18 acetylase RimI-like enzyme
MADVTRPQNNKIAYTVRFATEADIPAIREVARASWDTTYPHVPSETRAAFVSRSYSETALNHSLKRAGKDCWFWVVENTEKGIIGFGEVVLQPGSHPDAELTRIYLLSEWQGRGIGTAILNEMLATLRSFNTESDLRPPRLRLTVDVHNTLAIAFYEQRGFRFTRDYLIDLPESFGYPKPLEVKEYILEL